MIFLIQKDLLNNLKYNKKNKIKIFNKINQYINEKFLRKFPINGDKAKFKFEFQDDKIDNNIFQAEDMINDCL